MKKKTVLIHSNFSKAFTGFGKHKKNILRYLFKTGKYNLVELANGQYYSTEATEKMPWKCIGSLPNAAVLTEMKDPREQRIAGYGGVTIDKIIQEVKPDFYIGIEDPWAFEGYFDKPWWNKTNCMIWTTLDSLPILPSAIDFAPKVKYYYVWASFAQKALNAIGYNHVKTLRGSLDTSKFFKLPEESRGALKKKFGLDNAFVVGFVFRNQLRKSVPNLLDGFKLFKEKAPNAKLLLHTHWSEGWDIPRLIKEKGINNSDIITTYFCKHCKRYFLVPFEGQEKNCPHCGSEKTLNTTNIQQGVSESQLNEIYNVMDVYCHPFTSGGQEIPVQEAKLAELITLVTNYSCGEDFCTEESGGLPLEWAEYREPDTQFIKASTYAKSIAEQLSAIYHTPPEKRIEMGKKARKFVEDHCSIEVIGKKLEEIIDSAPDISFDFNSATRILNEGYLPDFGNSDIDFLIDIHKNMLSEIVDENHTSVRHWKNEIDKGATKEQIYEHFKRVAHLHSKKKEVSFESFLDSDDEDRRIAVVIPQAETDVLLINSLMRNLSKQYPKHNIYVITRPEYFSYIEDNIFIHKCIPYAQNIDNVFLLEGAGNHKGYFNLAFFPTTTTQKQISFIHNGLEKIAFSLT